MRFLGRVVQRCEFNDQQVMNLKYQNALDAFALVVQFRQFECLSQLEKAYMIHFVRQLIGRERGKVLKVLTLGDYLEPQVLDGRALEVIIMFSPAASRLTDAKSASNISSYCIGCIKLFSPYDVIMIRV